MTDTGKLMKLLELCDRATPGPRKPFMQAGPLLFATPGGQRIYAVSPCGKVDHEANAEHAAAFDPTTCAELVRELMRLREIVTSMAEIGCLRGRQVHCVEREPNSANWCVACQAKYMEMEMEIKP